MTSFFYAKKAQETIENKSFVEKLKRAHDDVLQRLIAGYPKPITMNSITDTVPTIALMMIVAVILVVIAADVMSRTVFKSRKTPPLIDARIPIIGGLLEFLKGPMGLMARAFPKFGEVFTVPVFHERITFLIGPKVSEFFFKAKDSEM